MKKKTSAPRFASALTIALALTNVAAEARPFAPLPVGSKIEVARPLQILAGDRHLDFAIQKDVACRLALANGKDVDFTIKQGAELAVLGGGVWKICTNLKSDDCNGRYQHCQSKSVGTPGTTQPFETVLKTVRLLCRLDDSGRAIARGYGEGFLSLKLDDETLSLKCWQTRPIHWSDGVKQVPVETTLEAVTVNGSPFKRVQLP